MPDDTGRPQASLDLDLAADTGARPMQPAGNSPASALEISAELCSFREDVHGLRRQQTAMTERLLEGQRKITDNGEQMVERGDRMVEAIEVLSAKQDSVVSLLERIADSSDRMADEMDKLEDVTRQRIAQENRRGRE